MRISINLATRPFVELRPLFARLRLAMAGLVLLAIGLGVGMHFLGVKARAAQAQMKDLKAQTFAFENERQTNERRMQQPQNRAVLDRSKFLNALFAKKSFSWTSVMMDLERVLPTGIQVTNIEPLTTPEGDVNIRLRVNGDRDRDVDLVRNLERSQRFLRPRLANETAQTQDKGVAAAQFGRPGVMPNAGANAGGVEFDILSGYNPLPAPVKQKTAQSVGTGAVKAAVKTSRPRTAPVPNKGASSKAPVAGGTR